MGNVSNCHTCECQRVVDSETEFDDDKVVFDQRKASIIQHNTAAAALLTHKKQQMQILTQKKELIGMLEDKQPQQNKHIDSNA